MVDVVDAAEDEDESLPRKKNTMASTAAAAMTTPSTSELEFDLAGGGACVSVEERSFAEDFRPMGDHSNPVLQGGLHGLAHRAALICRKRPRVGRAERKCHFALDHRLALDARDPLEQPHTAAQPYD